jgi:lysophospholipase L1-like esterase
MFTKCFWLKLWFMLNYRLWKLFATNKLPSPKGPIFSDGTNQFTDTTDLLNAEIIFIGDSITFLANWSRAFPNKKTANFGIGGNTTQNVIDRIDQLQGANPKYIVLRIGVNDLQSNMIPCEYESIYENLIQRIKIICPNSKLVVMSILPVTEEFSKARFNIKDRIINYNNFIYDRSLVYNLTFINDAHYFYIDQFNSEGYWSKPELMNDGIHPSQKGYEVIFERLNIEVKGMTK